MATKTIMVSDLSQKDIPDGEHARVVITDHPALRGGAVELDVTVAEAEKFQTKQLELVTLAVHSGAGAPRRVVMDSAEFASLLKGVDIEALIRSARKVSDGARSKSGHSRQSSGEKRDYSSPEWAGCEHRGRTTEAEAAWVRENLEAANANRAREGQAPIDPKDPKMIKRYGF